MKKGAENFLKLTGLNADLLALLSDFEALPSPLNLVLKVDPGSSPTHDISTPYDQPVSRKIVHLYMSNEPPLRALVHAVQRQQKFVDKMGHYLWIRSPALSNTLAHARQIYGNFFFLFSLKPSNPLVPTVDIDLVWHTHQCSASRYREYAEKTAGRRVDHDDTLLRKSLDGGLELTKDLYRAHYGVDYVKCLCWDCEALSAKIESSDGKLKPTDGTLQEIQGDVAFHRAFEVAGRKGEALPTRMRR